MQCSLLCLTFLNRNTVKIRAIIDCFELRINETPSTVEQRVLCYSSYKSSYTAKYLIAITPAGYISFISNGYGGHSTNGFVTVDSGFIDLLEANNLILADKGFPQIAYEIGKKIPSLLCLLSYMVVSYHLKKLKKHIKLLRFESMLSGLFKEFDCLEF